MRPHSAAQHWHDQGPHRRVKACQIEVDDIFPVVKRHRGKWFVDLPTDAMHHHLYRPFCGKRLQLIGGLGGQNVQLQSLGAAAICRDVVHAGLRLIQIFVRMNKDMHPHCRQLTAHGLPNRAGSAYHQGPLHSASPCILRVARPSMYLCP